MTFRPVFFKHERILTTYLFRELLLYFAVSFLFFFMVFFVNQILLLAENILKKRVPLWDVVRLVTYGLPFIIAQSAPFATLVGFLMCLGRMMSDNEILIIRASGCGYSRIILPVILLGFVISLFSFFVNDYLLPLGSLHYNRLYRSILASNPAVELEPNSVKRTRNATLVIGDVDGKSVSDLVFLDTDASGRQRIITAGRSQIHTAKNPGVIMQLNMTDAKILLFSKKQPKNYDVMTSGAVSLNIFESAFFDQKTGLSPNEMTSADLRKKIGSMEADKNISKKLLNRYQLEYNKKFSLPFASVFFALLAVPLAILFGRHNGQTIGLIIGIIICVIYWALMIIGQILASRNDFNGIAVMWLPDLLVGVSGSLFYLRLVKAR